MRNKEPRADENRANNTVIRKGAKAQIAVLSVKGEVRGGKGLYIPDAAQGTPICPQTAAVWSKGTARGCVARPVVLAQDSIPAGWCSSAGCSWQQAGQGHVTAHICATWEDGTNTLLLQRCRIHL